MREIALTLNGASVAKPAEARTHLADFLREEHLLTGTHLGCEQGVCGACTLFVDGRPVRSCIALAVACDGAEVRTIEGFAGDALMTRLREAFKRHHGLQCGYCTPGMLATAYDIVRRIPQADVGRIRRELSGNLCRCTGYAGIVAAIQDVLANDPPPAAVLPKRRQRQRPETGGRQAAAAGSGAAAQTVPDSGPDTLPGFGAYAAPEALQGATLTRSIRVDAPLDRVWTVVRDIPAVVACIPGASLDGPMQGEALSGKCEVSLGPMTVAFRGTAAVRLDEATKAGQVRGSGRDGLSRSSLDGSLTFSLQRDGEATYLDLSMVYRLKGPLAQFGRPTLVAEVADRILAQAAADLAARATGTAPSAPVPRKLGGVGLIGGVLYRLFSRLLWRR
ncbi:2Fe-2S iron-sulfur cluster-binding protein [Algihabitans albus]|uniref:2Fe-2S iron-sulfur cluster-binding protein n=1 Tax=Algihabitans albus TaxID=2164067 RepID=UPI000E5DA45A|nr:2Fe-2S iron-sulfur cluster-binding protein [Algihabitans albus]